MLTHNLDVFDVTADTLLAAHWDGLVFPGEQDEMSAPEGFDSAAFTFDPFVA
jgi:hypothetical protein